MTMTYLKDFRCPRCLLHRRLRLVGHRLTKVGQLEPGPGTKPYSGRTCLGLRS